MLAKREAGENARVINEVGEEIPAFLPGKPETLGDPKPRAIRRKRGRRDSPMLPSVDASADSVDDTST
jgi:hypothetical protein